MPRFRKKPVEIEAVHWDGKSMGPILAFEGNSANIGGPVDGKLSIFTLEGVMTASPGDWIIRGVHGELYPCKPQIFDATYEPID